MTGVQTCALPDLLKLEEEDLVTRTDLEAETIREVMSILKKELDA